MSAHFKWYQSSEETIIPWNARYSFPSQSTKAEKLTPRIPPKNGGAFGPGQVIRVEFPAQGYVNPLNTTLEFDVTLWGDNVAGHAFRFQNNIQSIFTRVRLLYGATPLEDIINYNHIVRALTEWTAVSPKGTIDQGSIADGIGGIIVDQGGGADANGVSLDPPVFGLVNVRQKHIQGVNVFQATGATKYPFAYGNSFGNVGTIDYPPGFQNLNDRQGYTRRYQVNLALGLFTQDKLVIN